jgi:hypothetical protein
MKKNTGENISTVTSFILRTNGISPFGNHTVFICLISQKWISRRQWLNLCVRIGAGRRLSSLLENCFNNMARVRLYILNNTLLNRLYSRWQLKSFIPEG